MRYFVFYFFIGSLSIILYQPVVNNNIKTVNHLTPQHVKTLTALYNNYYWENYFIIIMTANNIDEIPSDLISRVHEIDFNKNISPDLILDYIENIIDKHSKKT